jgi:hypothetical protein
MLSADERIELFRLAEQIPEEIRGALVREPEPMVLLRTMNRLPADRQRALFEEFLKQAEAEAEGADRTADDAPGQADSLDTMGDR